MTRLSLLNRHQPESPLALYGGETITIGRFLSDVADLSERLPERRYVLNLCEDRYHFLVGFAAALIRGQTSLFPPARAPRMLEEMREAYGDVYCFVDQSEYQADIETFRYERRVDTGRCGEMPYVPADLVAALVFTSGTTGRPQPHLKTWGSLVSVAKQTAARFALSTQQPASIVATVPPQHMYGLETSIMLPLQSSCMIHSARPFFPQDIRHALESMPAPRILVTTPVHIRACVSENMSLPSLAFILSATAPLPEQMASQAEAMFMTRVLEIYGCTEAGTIATRRTLEGGAWQTLDGIVVRGGGEECAVQGAHLESPVPLNDIVRTFNANKFMLLGRKSDLINIAGKRMSLGDLNHKLHEIEGVVDGVYVMPEEGEGPVTRLIAFVVAPGRTHDAIMAELRLRIDPVFLPRPLYLVESLPRNETGKLVRARLLQLTETENHFATPSTDRRQTEPVPGAVIGNPQAMSTSNSSAVRASHVLPENSCDVLIIGGGPGGSTAAAFLAQKGWRVVLLEKEHHPRFHIGESLLPLNMPLLERLGVREEVDKIGLLKLAAEFNCEGYEPATYYFANAMRKTYPSAYEVRRSEFDNLLLRNSQKKGAEVHEGVKVTNVETRPGQTSLISAVDEKGQAQLWEAKVVVDASGRDTFFANRQKMKQRNPQHNSSAIFGHFEGAVRRPGKDEGNISVYWFEHGWYWMIPLRDGAMSVGAVCWPYYLKSRKKSVDEFFMDTLALNPLVAERLKNARLMAPAMATGNFSYHADRMSGDGWLIVGDAYAFIDPVFSSGVFLAMNSAELAAEAIDDALRTGDLSAKSLGRHEKKIRRGLKTFSWFIYRVTTPSLRKMFMSPHNAFRMEEAILSLLSADIFGKTPIRFPLFVFKTVYYAASIISWRESLASYRQRHRAWHSKLDFVWKTDAVRQGERTG